MRAHSDKSAKIPPSHSGASYARRLGAIILAAAILRICLLVYVEWHPAKFDFPDSHRYLRVARHIAEGRGPIDSPEVSSGTDPVYPGILALGIRMGATSDPAALRFGRIANAFFSCCSILFVAAIARKFRNDRAALFAAAIMSIDPILLYFTGLVLTETVFVTALLAALWCLTGITDATSNRRAATAGILLGISALTRSTSFFLTLALMPAAWCMSPPKNRSRVVALALVGCAIMLAPSTIRNYRLFGELVPIRTGAGASLMEALGPWADGGPGMDRIVYPAMPSGANEVQRDRLCRDAALSWAREHPSETIRLAFTKLARTWSPLMHAEGHSSTNHQLIALASTIPVYLLALVGLFQLRRQKAQALLLLTPILYFTLVHMVFVGSVRYRVPMMPMLFILAGIALDQLSRSIGARHSSPRGD